MTDSTSYVLILALVVIPAVLFTYQMFRLFLFVVQNSQILLTSPF